MTMRFKAHWETSGVAIIADGLGLKYIKVRAVDSEGREVPDTVGEVTFEVSGAARLLAADNGDHYSDELFSGNKRTLYNGRALAILRAGKTSGDVTIKATVMGLKSVQQTFTVGPK